MGASFRGRAKGVELENCTPRHVMLAKEQPLSAGNRLGQMTHEASPEIACLILARKASRAPMPNSAVAPVNAIDVAAQLAADRKAPAHDKKPTFNELDATTVATAV